MLGSAVIRHTVMGRKKIAQYVHADQPLLIRHATESSASRKKSELNQQNQRARRSGPLRVGDEGDNFLLLFEASCLDSCLF